MQMSRRCLICDIAWTLGKSEEEFWQYSKSEREQLMATYLSRREREAVTSAHPAGK